MKKLSVLIFGILLPLLFTAASTNNMPAVSGPVLVYGGASAAAGTVKNAAIGAIGSGLTLNKPPPAQAVKVSRQITGTAKFIPVATGDFSDVNNCGPTACLNLLKYWHDLRGKQTLDSGNVKATYKKICTLTKFTSKLGMGNTYGYTGLQAFADKYCGASGEDYIDKAPLSWIKRNIDHNNMVILIIKASNYDPAVGGYHFVNCVGYYQPLKSNDVYLQIIDGWDHSTAHYYNAKYGNISAFYLRW